MPRRRVDVQVATGGVTGASNSKRAQPIRACIAFQLPAGGAALCFIVDEDTRDVRNVRGPLDARQRLRARPPDPIVRSERPLAP